MDVSILWEKKWLQQVTISHIKVIPHQKSTTSPDIYDWNELYCIDKF